MSIWSTKMISGVSNAVRNAFWQVLSSSFLPVVSDSNTAANCIQDWRWNLCRSAPHLQVIQQLSLSLQSNEQDWEPSTTKTNVLFKLWQFLISRVNYMDTKDFALEWVSPTLLDQSSLITLFQTRLSAEVQIHIYPCLKRCPLRARRPEDATKPTMLLCKFNMPKIKRTVLMMTNIL